MSDTLRVLAIEPFCGGSHRAFLDAVARHSRHQWHRITHKPVHWKWRMRSAPLALAGPTRQFVDRHGLPDVVFASDMLDLPTFWGLLREPSIATCPTVVYFHESQWNYPLAPNARPDLHFGYTNLLTAIAADECWFNSHFHQSEFLAASRHFVSRMPDSRRQHDLGALADRCRVLPPGFDPPDPLPEPQFPSDCRDAADRSRPHGEITIGWVSRWEHDKRPDRFLTILANLERLAVPFRLLLAGPRPQTPAGALAEIRQQYADRILGDGFAVSTADYWRILRSMDVVVSTADHENFGIAVWEAVWAGAIPVLPRRLSYPEFTPGQMLYDDLEQASEMIKKLSRQKNRDRLCDTARSSIESLQMKSVVPAIDDRLQRLVAADHR